MSSQLNTVRLPYVITVLDGDDFLSPQFLWGGRGLAFQYASLHRLTTGAILKARSQVDRCLRVSLGSDRNTGKRQRPELRGQRNITEYQ